MKKITFILILISSVLMIDIHAFADLGPKQTMSFQFENDTNESIAIVKGQQLECKNLDCSENEPLENGPHGFSCDKKSYCYSLASGYPSDKHKLIIEFTDKTRESNVFESKTFNAFFKVKITDNALIVKELNVPIIKKPNISEDIATDALTVKELSLPFIKKGNIAENITTENDDEITISPLKEEKHEQ